jgi:hypothetical protein
MTPVEMTAFVVICGVSGIVTFWYRSRLLFKKTCAYAVPTFFLPTRQTPIDRHLYFGKTVFFSKIYFGCYEIFLGMSEFRIFDDEAQCTILTLHVPIKSCFLPVSK